VGQLAHSESWSDLLDRLKVPHEVTDDPSRFNRKIVNDPGSNIVAWGEGIPCYSEQPEKIHCYWTLDVSGKLAYNTPASVDFDGFVREAKLLVHEADKRSKV
jgi:hypothetical protein